MKRNTDANDKNQQAGLPTFLQIFEAERPGAAYIVRHREALQVTAGDCSDQMRSPACRQAGHIGQCVTIMLTAWLMNARSPISNLAVRGLHLIEASDPVESISLVTESAALPAFTDVDKWIQRPGVAVPSFARYYGTIGNIPAVSVSFFSAPCRTE